MLCHCNISLPCPLDFLTLPHFIDHQDKIPKSGCTFKCVCSEVKAVAKFMHNNVCLVVCRGWLIFVHYFNKLGQDAAIPRNIILIHDDDKAVTKLTQLHCNSVCVIRL